MLEKPEFVPMARPYAFHIPIFIYLPIRVGFASSAPDMTNERTRPVCAGTGRRRISGICFFPEHVCQLLAPKVINVEASSQRYEE